uniref:Vacuolar protein sorting 13 homolog A n=1 Tax=Astyanax mexicanus TaxID=7994 RepID=A0A8B9KTF7_ASTMX
MVFESLVVDVLNRFLGDYVVNLDSSQLNLGIWGGEGADSGQRTAAGSQLDIPFKVRAGHIGRLELKIPWKNLYTQSVEATLDEVYLLIVPTASIKYDAEKEEKQLQEARQRELQRIEETKQKAAQQENPKTEKQDTFVEKLVTQVIKNLQVKISNIHVRYEDDVTNPNCPLSFGVSLQNLSLQLVRLDNLFAYWNVNSELYSNHTPPELRMNPRSDVDFSSPKVDLVVNLPEVAVELSRPQYVSILELLGSVDMMSRNLPYRKYRPCVPVHNNAYNWWRYVISGVLEVNVKPRLHMWSWQHIRRHRQLAKQYKELYKTKITSKKPTEVVLKKLEDTEKTLDIFNITLARQQAEMEVKHRLQTSGFDTLMTPAEKAKLYTAIGYSETAVNPNLPKSVHMKVRFQLVSMSVSIKESREKPEIIKLSVIGLSATLTQRPSAQAIKIIAQLSTFEVTGLPRSNVAPMLLSSRRVVEENKPLLSLMFETNPLDAKADQRLHVESQPLEIIYDATTVNSLSAFFMPPNDLQLDELTNATRMKLEQFRDRTSTGLMYIIETQKVLDLKINLMASYVIVPQMGFYDPSHNLAILDLGHFQVNKANLPQLLAGSSTIEDIMSRAYDSFDVQLSNGDWKKARKERQSALHILEPVDLKVVFSRAMVVTDSRMPKFKMSGELPLLSLRISDDKVRGVLELIDSIPLPESRPPPRAAATQVTPKVGVCVCVCVCVCLLFTSRFLQFFFFFFFTIFSEILHVYSLNLSLFLPLLLQLSIQLLRLSAGQEVPVLHLEIEGLGTELKLRTFDMSSYTFLREICLECSEYQADKEVFDFRMVNYVDATEGDAYMDMQIVDTSVTLTVGCIQVIFLNKFVSSVLAFINNFQEAKEALAEVTVQAAEKAATGVLELAEKSTRISLDVDIKAPVVFLPQSSISTNVIVADLGLVTVKNHFEIVPSPSHTKIPPILDVMSVALSDLKMYRWVFALTDYDSYRRCDHDIFGWFVLNMSDVSNSYIFHPYRTTFKDEKFQTEIQLLKPVNMDLSIKRNLSASWYHSLPDIQINAHLKPMSVSSEDMIVVLRTLSENLSETSDAVPAPKGSDKAETSSTKESQGSGEFTLGTISTAVHMYSDSSMTASVKLAECLLDDKRKIVKMITSRMMAMRKGAEQNTMVDVNYRQGREGTTLETVVQDLYLCASMEFLLTVADIFMKAMAQGFSSPPKSNKQTSTATKDPAASKMEMNIVVKNPEIVFVADLTRADAPALVMTTQCELLMKSDPNSQQMTAAITDLKVVACPFVHKQQDSNITTVLQPCQVFFTSKQSPTQPQAIELSINSLTLKVSPIIINTVITIQSALTPAAETPEELESPVPPDLWERRDWKDLKLWFLEEEGEEDTQSVTPLIPQGESLQLRISSICLTLEAGVGHRTVPMLLAKSSFHGDVKNWSSTSLLMHFLVNLLQVNYYNEIMGVWEPLLEPLEDDTKDGFRPWTLDLKVRSMVNFLECKLRLFQKCALLLTDASQAFAEAAKQTAECFQKDQAPFVVKNRLGLPVSVLYSEVFKPIGVQSKGRTVELQDGESLNMDYTLTTADADQFSAMTSLSSKNYIQPSKTVSPVGHTTASVIPLIKVGRGMYSVMHLDSGVTRFFICQISSNEGSKFVKIRSPFQFINHFSVPFRVFEGSTCLGVSLPNEEFCVPLGSYKAQLSLQPAAEGDEQYECSESFSYDEVSQKPDECVEKTCRHHSSDAHVFKVNMVAVRDTVTSLSAQEEFDKPYVLHLWPTVLLRNLLPYPITYSLLLHTAVMDHSSLELKLLGYLQQDWVAHYHLRNDHDEINFITFRSALQDDDVDGESSRAELDIAVHVKKEAGQAVVAVHSPYWMVNKTGRLLQYKADDIHRKHPKDYDMPLLFSFKPRNFLQNNKVRLMISDSELSDDFSIDTVGSYGDVKCKGRAKDYLVGVKIDASSFSLTRLVTVLPFYIGINLMELRQQCLAVMQAAVPFWPERESKKMKVKVDGCQTAAHTINFHQPENCLLLHLDNTLGGIIVDVNLTEHSAVIRFSDYHDGAAPFLLINHTKDKTLEFYQSSHQQEKEELAPGRAVYYTWAEPTGSRVLRWSWGPYSGELKNEEGKLFVISFYEGLQRVALFTTERRIYKLLCESERVELAEQEISLALQDMGISLVNNSTSQEIAYIGITSSDVVWEIKPKKKSRWKVLNGKDAEILEQHYKSYLESSPVCLTPNGVDMRMLQPYDAPLRRNFLTESQFTKQLLLFCPQIQNQLPGAIFPFVFYPIKPPKSVRMDSEPKPFTDVSIITRAAGHSDILRIKYVELFEKDIEYLKTGLNPVSATDTSPISLYEYFHISPIKLHLSFSLSSGGEDGNKTKRETEMIPVQSLNLLLKSIGATLTDVQDVVFKLAFFELTFQFRTTQQLQWEVIRHYSKQAIKQMYVLVLGLDVLGNPFGLIRGLSEGVEAFFYEPYQGAIQGPEEFVEGMALGVKALVGGAVGGLAGAASRITGAMAKGVAAMTMDEEYQQKRREAMNKQPSGLKEGLTRGGKGLGFVSGITGIVTKPIKGAQKEGAAGFFKGVGKGLVGAVTRPTGGIIDMASSTFQGIKRAAETSQDVESLRPPRFIHEDGVIRPYKEREGFGSQMLQVTCSLLTCRLPSFPYSQIYYIKS